MGDTCSEDVDECQVDNGGCTGTRDTCVNTMGSFYCVDADTTLVYPETTQAHAERHYRLGIILVNGKEPFPASRSDYVYSSTMSYRLNFYDKEDVGQAVFESAFGVKAFFDEISYGKANISGVVVDWQDDYGESRTADDIRDNRDTYFAEAWSSIDPRQYDAFLLVGLADAGMVQTGWLMSSNSVPDEDGNNLYPKGIVFLINSTFFTTAGETRFDGWLVPSVPWQHELLHSMGVMGHSQTLWCYPEQSAYDATASHEDNYDAANVTLSDWCDLKGYGDPFSLMGERLWATHPSAASKVEMGWLSEDDGLVSIDASILGSSQIETTDVLIYPHAGQDLTKNLAIQVKVPEFTVNTMTGAVLTLDRVTIEYRGAMGLDQYMSALGQGPRAHSTNASWYLDATYSWDSDFGELYELESAIETDGVLVYLDSTTDDSEAVYLVDANPTAEGVKSGVSSPKGHPGNAGKFASAMVSLGQTFSSASLPFELSVIEVVADAAGQSAIRVRIEPSSESE